MALKETIQEFKEFAIKGNVVDMAVGVIIGGAFGKIVTSFVNDFYIWSVMRAGQLLVVWVQPGTSQNTVCTPVLRLVRRIRLAS